MKAQLVDTKGPLRVTEGKEGRTRSVLWQYWVDLGMLFILNREKLELEKPYGAMH